MATKRATKAKKKASSVVKKNARSHVVKKTKSQVVKKTKSQVVKKNIMRTAHTGHDKGKCGTCGYHMIWLHAGDCPLCRMCVRCGNRVRHCVCLEGE